MAAAQSPQHQGKDPHLEQLANCRAGILDPETSVDGRRRWIDNLLSYETPPAKALFAELLGDAGNPTAQLAMCKAVAWHARRNPERLSPSFAEPLIELLGSDSPGLRAAAAAALADFPSEGIVAKLGSIAARPDASMEKRLAAIDAMVSKVGNREVIGELMALLDAGVPGITERVVAALEPVSREAFGNDLDRWRAWWDVRKGLSDEAWLSDQLAVYRDRVHDLTHELQTRLQDERRRRDSLTARLEGLQREVFRSLGPDQQESRLAEWLEAPEVEVQRVALELIAARMADEGRRPGPGVRAALLRLLDAGGIAIRRSILEIVQNLENESAVIDAVLAQLSTVQDPALRSVVFRALGKLDSEKAIPALVFEIASPHSDRECVREAAIALGHIASGATGWRQAEDAAIALKSRYKLESGEDPQLRAALLAAMAGVGNPTFAPQFLDALESDESNILRPAIQGVRVTRDRSKISRLRALTASPDSLVRLAAIQAIGELGGSDADIEAVLTRLIPSIEPDESAREAAWTALCAFLAGKSLADKLRHAQRLRDTPGLETKYLQQLLEDAAATGLEETEAETIRARLADGLVMQGLYADAGLHFRKLCLARLGRADPNSESSCRAWLDAAARVAEAGEVSEIVGQLLDACGEDGSEWIADSLIQVLGSPSDEAQRERHRQVLRQLRSMDASRLGAAWATMLETLERNLAPPEDEPRQSPDSP